VRLSCDEVEDVLSADRAAELGRRRLAIAEDSSTLVRLRTADFIPLG
jgi:hypothetical protein